MKYNNKTFEKVLEEKNKKPTMATMAWKFQNKMESSTKHRVLILGDPKTTEEVSNSLRSEGINTESFKTVKSLKLSLNGREEAIIYCAPLVRSEILSVHRNFTKKVKSTEVSFFAVVPSWLNSSKERDMYKMGIRMIFEWPREKSEFAHLFSEALRAKTIGVHSADADQALRKAILNRILSHYGSFFSDLDICVYNGIVMARGSVDSLGRKNELSQFIKSIPGVRGFIGRSLYVGVDEESGSPKLSGRSNQLLSDMKDVPDSTLRVEVDDASHTLKLKGTAPDKDTIKRVKEHLSLFKGVQDVQSDVQVAPDQYDRDLTLAKRSQRVINKITVGSPLSVKVKVLKGKAFLKGEVISGIQRSQITHAIASLKGIKSVIDQMEVKQTSMPYVINQ